MTSRDETPFPAAPSALGYLYQCGYALLATLRRLRVGADFGVSLETLLFCEVDRHARVVPPEFRGTSGRTRVRQEFKPRPTSLPQWYAPKWEPKLPGGVSGKPGQNTTAVSKDLQVSRA